RIEPEPTPATEEVRRAPLNRKPYWDLERARLGQSRKVPVEVVVNGHPVATKEIVADGSEQAVSFDIPIQKSSWIALRIFPSSHTNPVFVVVNDKPIRASQRSAEWCLKAIDKCWQQKQPRIRAGAERDEARKAYDTARAAYRAILAESVEP